MVVSVAVIGGEKGSGKTTLMEKLISHLSLTCHGLLEVKQIVVERIGGKDTVEGRPVGGKGVKGPRGHACGRFFIVGPYRESRDYSGTDALSMTVSNDVKQLLKSLKAKRQRYFVIYEGLRLFTGKMMEFLHNEGIHFRIYVLDTSPDVADAQRKIRSGILSKKHGKKVEQTERSILAARTQVANMVKGQWSDFVRVASQTEIFDAIYRRARPYVSKSSQRHLRLSRPVQRDSLALTAW